MSKSLYHFGAGPAQLPKSILQEAQAELLDWQGSGLSILEVGHRTPPFTSLLENAKSLLRELLAIPSNYQILFLGMPARAQFALIPMNFLRASEKGAYLISGFWSELAFNEAKKIKPVYSFSSDPEANTGYLYYTPNETITGVRTPEPPDSKGVPLIADMTSCLLSEPVDVSQYGLIFAGAQKNIANAGLTVVIVSNEMLARVPEPPLADQLNYRSHAAAHSLLVTPPVFNCYLAEKMCRWVKAEGGVTALFQRNQAKAKALYDLIDASAFYKNSVEPQARSLVNICFTLPSRTLEAAFIERANERGLTGLEGHRIHGGIRASLYNAMPMEGVDALIDMMRDFQNTHDSR